VNLLADQSFPASVQLSAQASTRVWRWSNEDLSDIDFVDLAAKENFSGVIFLGTAALYSQELRERARAGGIALLGTSELDPVTASIAVGSNLQAISRLVRPGAVLTVYAREVKSFEG
jgi:hypothetical protein